MLDPEVVAGSPYDMGLARKSRTTAEVNSTAEELCRRESSSDCLVNNAQTAFATIAVTGPASRSLWVAERPVSADGFREHRFDRL